MHLNLHTESLTCMPFCLVECICDLVISRSYCENDDPTIQLHSVVVSLAN